ncbi:MAG: AMP-binding protein [Deltaproteobacteria bacterium]|nr:MAG: AMP-binding protein [Deltaproteobacteria bacterium]
MADYGTFEQFRQKYPKGNRSDNTWGSRLEKIARAIPDRTAFIQGERELTWRQFNERVNRLANALLDLGIKKEDRVAIMGFNSIEWMESYFAASRIGAVPVNVNPRFIPKELKHILEDSDSVTLILEEEWIEKITQITKDLPLLKHCIVMGDNPPSGMLSYDGLIGKYPDSSPKLSWGVTNEDFAFLFYTGGTTGYPKGTVWDGETRVRGLDIILVNAMAPLFDQLGNLPKEAYPALKTTIPIPGLGRFIVSDFGRRVVSSPVIRALIRRLMRRRSHNKLRYRLSGGRMKLIAVAPLFHGTAYECNFSLIGTGGCTSIYLASRHPFNPGELWETVEKRRANAIVIVGDAFAIPMVEELDRRKYDTSSLSSIISSGVIWSPRIKKRLLEHIPGLLVIDELGTTETSSAFTQLSSSAESEISKLRVKLASKGDNVTRVLNPQTGRDVRPGEKGELVYGGYTALGYWKDRAKTEKQWKAIDGKRWFFVGDEGTVDEDGYFHFIGRGPTIINTGGEKVYPEEVEETVKTHPKVRDAAVVGIPDERWGEAVTAIVELKEGEKATPEEIIDFCRERMAGYKKPKQVLFVDRLPRAAAGKLERKPLQELATKMLGRSE